MKVSILICTYNRAPFLDKVLRSLVDQEFEGEHEIIVVDNNSTDESKAMVEKWMPLANSRCPIRYVFAASQGLSHARNVGAAAADGDVIAFIDDDATAEVKWLQRIVDNLADPSIACVGGKVIPEWSEPPPDWITPELWPAIGGSIHGDVRCVMTGRLYPMGGNMAVRNSWNQTIGGFNVQFGRVGTNLASGDEVEFADRLRRHGAVMVYDPQMIIYHHVPESRMTREFFLQRWYWEGRSVSAWQRVRGGKFRQWIVGLLRIFITAPRDLLGLLIHTTVGNRSLRFVYHCRLRKLQGYADELWQSLGVNVPGQSRAREGLK